MKYLKTVLLLISALDYTKVIVNGDVTSTKTAEVPTSLMGDKEASSSSFSSSSSSSSSSVDLSSTPTMKSSLKASHNIMISKKQKDLVDTALNNVKYRHLSDEDYWSQIGLDIDGENANDATGAAISISGDGYTVAIGTSNNDGTAHNAGHVRVYRHDTQSFTQLGLDIDGDGSLHWFGSSVSLSDDGNTVAVGALGDDDAAYNAGTVRVYTYSSNTWTQLGDDIDAEPYSCAMHGYDVSLSSDGRTVAIGAKGNGGTASAAGHVRVYTYSSNTWTQLGVDIDGDGANDQFGWSVSLSSDGLTVAIGGNDSYTRVYTYISGTWTQLGDDIVAETASDYAGRSVSLSSDGSTVAIGAFLNSGNGSYSGHVRVFRYISDTWTQLGDDIDGEAASDQSGYAVSISSSGNTVAIGAPYNDGNGSDSGHVRVYGFDQTNGWTKIGDDIDGEAADDNSGWGWNSVSLSDDGRTVAIGAKGNDDNGSNSGHVRVFALTSAATQSPSPSTIPSSVPSSVPSESIEPSLTPSLAPSSIPSVSIKPSTVPSLAPSSIPSTVPSLAPSTVPSLSIMPSTLPSLAPSSIPSLAPSSIPSTVPSLAPSTVPSLSIMPSTLPSLAPSSIPSTEPSLAPSSIPSTEPSESIKPSSSPSRRPTRRPTRSPTRSPTGSPFASPSIAPTAIQFPNCIDSTLRLIIQGSTYTFTKSCEWVAKMSSRCSLPGISQACPVTCGTCATCADPSNDLSFKFGYNGRSMNKNCDWVGSNVSKMIERCGATNNICRSTCDSCDIIPTEAPTKSPTKTPTKTPTSNPAIEQVTSSPSSETLITSCIDSTLTLQIKKLNGVQIARGCAWVARKKTTKRCSLPGISEACPVTCGTCATCADPNNAIQFNVVLSNGKVVKKGCAWVGNKANMISKRCETTNNICRSTCGQC